MWIHRSSSKWLFFEDTFPCIQPYMLCLFVFFPPLFDLDPHEWEQKLDPQACISAGFFWELEHFKMELFQVVGLSLLVQLRLVVCDLNLCACLTAFLTEKKRKVSSYISSVHISHLNKQTCQCKEIPLQPTVHCLFTWTVAIVPQTLATSSHRPTEPGRNLHSSTACCQFLSPCLRDSHIRFPYIGTDMIKHIMGRKGTRNGVLNKYIRWNNQTEAQP